MDDLELYGKISQRSPPLRDRVELSHVFLFVFVVKMSQISLENLDHELIRTVEILSHKKDVVEAKTDKHKESITQLSTLTSLLIDRENRTEMSTFTFNIIDNQ